MMYSAYAAYLMAQDRINERHREADNERLARTWRDAERERRMNAVAVDHSSTRSLSVRIESLWERLGTSRRRSRAGLTTGGQTV